MQFGMKDYDKNNVVIDYLFTYLSSFLTSETKNNLNDFYNQLAITFLE